MASAPKPHQRADISPTWLLSSAADWPGAQLALQVRYVGNGKHKTYWPPMDRPAEWKPVFADDGQTERCDQYSPEVWGQFSDLLAQAIAGGFVAADKYGRPLVADDGKPLRVFVWVGGQLNEARYSRNNQYHAFPLTRRACWPEDPAGRLAQAPRLPQ
jgi:hypothetical protein